MPTRPFPPLNGLTFESVIPGSDRLARYRDSVDGRCVTVERHPAKSPAFQPGDLTLNDEPEVVAHVTEVHTVEDAHYVVCAEDFAATVGARIQDRRWSARDRLRTIGALAASLRVLQARGVVHGDLTPEGLLLTHDGALRIAPFTAATIAVATAPVTRGGARTFGPTLSRERATGGALGYLAPEQLLASTTTSASDIFSWGCIAYEMATGRSPFGFVTELTTLVAAMAKGPARSIASLSGEFSPLLDEAVARAVRVDSSSRALPEVVPEAWLTTPTQPGVSQPARDAQGAPVPASSAPRALLAAIATLLIASAIYFVTSR